MAKGISEGVKILATAPEASGGGMAMKAPVGLMTEKPLPTKGGSKKLSDEQLNKFANWIDGDVKQYALDLAKRGLNNVTDLLYDPAPNPSVSKNLSAWKPALIQRLLAAGRRRGYNPDQFQLDRENLLKETGGTEAINHPMFKKDKENFWGVVRNIYQDQLAKEAAISAPAATLLVKK